MTGDVKMTSKMNKDKEGIDYVFIGGGEEQDSLAEELSKRGYTTASIGFQKGLGQFVKFHESGSGLEASVRRCNEALARSAVAVEEIKEYSDPIEFEKAFQRVLENQSVSPTTFWREEELQTMPQEQREFLEKQISEYRDLKGLMQQIYQNTAPEDPKRKVMMDFDPRKVFGSVALQEEAIGPYMGFYSRLVQNCLAVELIKALKNRELGEAEKLDDRGDELNQERSYREALPYFDKALELSPRFSLAWINKGIALKNLGRLDEAICYNCMRCWDCMEEKCVEYKNEDTTN